MSLIHDFAMRTAEQIGCEFPGRRINRILATDIGAEIKGSDRVYIGREELLALIDKSAIFRLYPSCT